MESLYPDVIRLHEVGVVRALSGAMDCVAGALIGVLAIPLNILRADLGRARQHFADLRKSGASTDGQQFQLEFGSRFESLIAEAGPAGWLEWLLAYRNMLVHRGRRIEIGQFVPREPRLFGADGRVIPRVKVVRHAPREPLRSDMDVLRQPELPPVLTEDAQQTLQGLVASVCFLVDALGAELLTAWEHRKARPELLAQPQSQWPDADPKKPTVPFLGYSPGSFAYLPGQLMGHPVSWRRLEAAALFDHQRTQWSGFD